MICSHPSRIELWPPAAVHDVPTASLIAEYAGQSLLAELMLTPKPGLVDQRNSGAHRDMNLQTFLYSSRAVSNWFPVFVELGLANGHMPCCEFLPLVRPAGLLCEQAMLQATRGINTHKGAIFSLGLLCAASGRLLANGIPLTQERICLEVANVCAGLIDRELNTGTTANSAGERIFKQYGLPGARGEAVSGYSIVRSVAMPVYDTLQSLGVARDVALLQVLLHLLAVNGDTNVVSRGGLPGLDYVRSYSRDLLSQGGALAPDGLKRLADFDDELIARNLSPGGSADLLAVTWFLAKFPK